MSIPRNWEPALDVNIWKFVFECLSLSPSKKDNGISRVSRIMNIRWRAKLFPVINEMVEGILDAHGFARWNLSLLDLQDIIPGYQDYIGDQVTTSKSSGSTESDVVESAAVLTEVDYSWAD